MWFRYPQDEDDYTHHVKHNCALRAILPTGEVADGRIVRSRNGYAFVYILNGARGSVPVSKLLEIKEYCIPDPYRSTLDETINSWDGPTLADIIMKG